MSEHDGLCNRWRVTAGESKTIELDDVEALTVLLLNGRVDVIGTDDPVTRVEVTNVGGEPIGIEMRGHRLHVTHPEAIMHGRSFVFADWKDIGSSFFDSRNHARVRADVSLLVPRSIQVEIAMIRGDTLVSGLTRGAELSTASGTVVSDGLTGKLGLNTASGKVEARNHHGSVETNSASGEVVLSGDFSKVESNSASGDLYIDAFGAPEHIAFNAVSGNMAIRLDPEIRARYDIVTISGHALIDGSRFKTRFNRSLTYEDGPERGSRTHVEFNAVSGSVKVVRREAVRFDPQESNDQGDSHDDDSRDENGGDRR